MHLGLILDMTRAGLGGRTAISAEDGELTYEQLAELSWRAANTFRDLEVPSVVYLGGNQLAFAVALFGAAGAGVPFIPLNYRLGPAQLAKQLEVHAEAYLISDTDSPTHSVPGRRSSRQGFLDSIAGASAEPPPPQDPELPCVLLYTSGTTSAPKAAVLRHRHLMSYLLSTVEFAGADETEATLVAVPPYHIAGIANLLSNLYGGRRILYVDRFEPEAWLETVRSEHVTHAMVIPTMLARVVDHLGSAPQADTPSLRSISYGGARMPAPVLRRALELFPEVDFVNAYGLTETSSTIALLGPEDHRMAIDSEDPLIRRRLDSVGRPVPGIEIEIRDELGTVLPDGEVGLLFVRGKQISGEYTESTSVDPEGWFPTRDRARVDDGYLYIEGRADDTIIRGGENIAPAEIEDVLISHQGIIDAVVVGIPDEEWGQRLVAVVVRDNDDPVSADQLKEFVRGQLRSSKTPEEIEFWAELPRTETGKLLRRHVVTALSAR
jgi:acyl-CoA synthetase (AMP-forming)/AMP-acid ligase II